MLGSTKNVKKAGTLQTALKNIFGIKSCLIQLSNIRYYLLAENPSSLNLCRTTKALEQCMGAA